MAEFGTLTLVALPARRADPDGLRSLGDSARSAASGLKRHHIRPDVLLVPPSAEDDDFVSQMLGGLRRLPTNVVPQRRLEASDSQDPTLSSAGETWEEFFSQSVVPLLEERRDVVVVAANEQLLGVLAAVLRRAVPDGFAFVDGTPVTIHFDGQMLPI